VTEPEQIDMTPLPDNSIRDIAGLRAYLVAASETLEAKLPAPHNIIGNKRKTLVAIAQSRIVAFREVVAMIDAMSGASEPDDVAMRAGGHNVAQIEECGPWARGICGNDPV